jgi:branched-chain amino acid transport system ATP-binding protein
MGRRVLLEVKNLEAGYGKKQILYNISLSVQEGEIVGLIGHNGAGKSTTLKSIFGLVPPFRGQVVYEGQDITLQPPAVRLDAGIYHIPQEDFIFSDLTVKENLEMSFFTMRERSNFESRLSEVYTFFPVLTNRRNQLAGTLSGGERRMLGIGMGLLRRPKLVLVDEPSSGLAPVTFQNVAKIIQEINTGLGTAVVLVEQNVKVAFKLSQRVYVMKAGRMILEETGAKLLERKDWWDLF